MGIARGSERMTRPVAGLGILAVLSGGCDTPEALPEVDLWGVEQTLVIGAEDHPSQALTRVGSMALGPSGHLFVSQPQDRAVRVYTESGELLRTIGRPGDGPGEFRSILSIGFVEDSLYVVDSALRRVSFFAEDGDHLVTRMSTGSALREPFGPPIPVLPLKDGTAVAVFPQPVESTERSPYVRIDLEGQVLDTVGWQEARGRRVSLARGTAVAGVGHPFPESPLVTMVGGTETMIVVDRPAPTQPGRSEFRVTWASFDGDTLWTRGYPYVPAPIAPAFADSAIATVIESPALRMMYPEPDQARDALLDQVAIPRFHPPVHAVEVADDGEIWIAREPAGEEGREWLVLEPTGEIAARVLLPSAVRVRVIRGDLVWGVYTDELDVPYLVRYRIRNSP
jgi:hypothetical protein